MVAGRTARFGPIAIGHPAFIAGACLVFLYVLARAVCVPVTHDEAMTFFVYVETGDFLPFLAHWDAGNHVLCTALAWGCFKAFGLHAWALRLPSVLAFVLYAWYAHRWGQRVRDTVVRNVLWAALLLTPFLLDFFSLFRGYGLAIAFWSMALYELCAFITERRTRRLALLLPAMFLATWSSLSLATLQGFVLVLVPFVVLGRPRESVRTRRQLLLWAIVGLGGLAFTASYLWALAKGGALYYGLGTGILEGTVPSLLHAMFGPVGNGVTVLVVLVVAGCAATAVLARRGDRSFGSITLAISIGLLLADVLARIVLFRVNGTLFPEDRTALQWVPLFVLAFAFAVDHWTAHVPGARWAIVPILLFPVRAITTADLTRTGYWPAEAISDNIYRAVEERQRASAGPLTLGAYHQMPPPWAFGLRERGLSLAGADAVGFPDARTDLLLIDPERRAVPAGYRPIATGASGRVQLLERERRADRTLVLDSMIALPASDAEFRELWHPPLAAVRGQAYLVGLDLAITSPDVPLVMDLIVETDADGAGRHYASTLLQFCGGRWQGDSLHVVRRVPSIAPDARRTVVYFWDPERMSYSCSGRLRVWRTE